MNIFIGLQLAFYFLVLIALVKPLGAYMARVYHGETIFLSRLFGPVEQLIYKIMRVSPEDEMSWKVYAINMLLLNFFGLLLVYLLQRL
jgi:K+-transporting ATPase ATPase A chain